MSEVSEVSEGSEAERKGEIRKGGQEGCMREENLKRVKKR